MRLQQTTPIFVTGQDGTSKMTLGGLFDAIVGGTKWEDIEITTDKKESEENEKKRLVIKNVIKLVQQMSTHQAETILRAIDTLIQNPRENND